MDKSADTDQRPSSTLKHQPQTVALCFVLVAVLVVASIQMRHAPNKHFSPIHPGGVSVVVDINRATIEELQLLPGVGEKLASDIVSYRNEIGAFKALDELMNVRGIKGARFEQISPYLVISADSDAVTETPASQR